MFRMKVKAIKWFKVQEQFKRNGAVIYFFNLLYWSIVDLPCCINFCCTAKWFSFTYIHSFSYSFPLWSITGYWIYGCCYLDLILISMLRQTPTTPFSVLFFFLFLAALGLHCCTQAFSSCGERGLLFVLVRRLLIVVASPVVEHGL